MALALLCGIEAARAASAPGDVVGKLTVGYQGWFACAGDGSPANRWVHWAGSQPSPGNQSFEIWPDCREFASTYQTGYASLGNGQPARLYSAYDNNVVDTHLKWMQQYGIDTVAVQRFGSELGDSVFKAQRDGIASKVRNAAQTFGRKFYIMYDISGWNSFQSAIKTDWTNTIVGSLQLTSSLAYAKQNGKPVVCVWGIGVAGRPGDVNSWKDVINWFKNQGCYVIVGTHRNWRTDGANFPAYVTGNMISPWTVGSYKYDVEIDSYSNDLYNDQVVCNQYGVDFQPVVFPGFAWSNWNGGDRNAFPRRHGDFMWRQFAQVRNRSIPSVYVAMFDEFDEGTAIAKAAENASMKPTNQYFLTLDADGVACSSDFYLRLTGDGAKMVKGLTSLVWAHPTTHMPAGVTGIEAGAVYEIEPKNAAGKRLDVSGISTANGAVIHIWDDTNGGNQRWKFEAQTDGTFELIPQHATDKRLDVSGASAADGASVDQWTDLNQSNQRWMFERQSDGSYEIIPAHANRLRLNVVGGGTANGVRVEIRTDSNAASMRWSLLKQ